MFFAIELLSKKTVLGRIWLVGTTKDTKRILSKKELESSNIQTLSERILNTEVPFALRISAHLLLGIVVIYRDKTKHFLNDVNELLLDVNRGMKVPIRSPSIPATGSGGDSFLPHTVPHNRLIDLPNHRWRARHEAVTLSPSFAAVTESVGLFLLGQGNLNGSDGGKRLSHSIFDDSGYGHGEREDGDDDSFDTSIERRRGSGIRNPVDGSLPTTSRDSLASTSSLSMMNEHIANTTPINRHLQSSSSSFIASSISGGRGSTRSADDLNWIFGGGFSDDGNSGRVSGSEVSFNLSMVSSSQQQHGAANDSFWLMNDSDPLASSGLLATPHLQIRSPSHHHGDDDIQLAPDEMDFEEIQGDPNGIVPLLSMTPIQNTENPSSTPKGPIIAPHHDNGPTGDDQDPDFNDADPALSPTSVVDLDETFQNNRNENRIRRRGRRRPINAIDAETEMTNEMIRYQFDNVKDLIVVNPVSGWSSTTNFSNRSIQTNSSHTNNSNSFQRLLSDGNIALFYFDENGREKFCAAGSAATSLSSSNLEDFLVRPSASQFCPPQLCPKLFGRMNRGNFHSSMNAEMNARTLEENMLRRFHSTIPSRHSGSGLSPSSDSEESIERRRRSFMLRSSFNVNHGRPSLDFMDMGDDANNNDDVIVTPPETDPSPVRSSSFLLRGSLSPAAPDNDELQQNTSDYSLLVQTDPQDDNRNSADDGDFFTVAGENGGNRISVGGRSDGPPSNHRKRPRSTSAAGGDDDNDGLPQSPGFDPTLSSIHQINPAAILVTDVGLRVYRHISDQIDMAAAEQLQRTQSAGRRGRASLSLFSLAKGSSKRSVALTFYHLLTLTSVQCLRVEQKKAFGDISIIRGVQNPNSV